MGIKRGIFSRSAALNSLRTQLFQREEQHAQVYAYLGRSHPERCERYIPVICSCYRSISVLLAIADASFSGENQLFSAARNSDDDGGSSERGVEVRT